MATVRGHTQLFENPLVEGLERLPVHPTTLVIFGASGDLAKRKLLPAIYNLAHEGALPERFNLIGSARSEWSDDEFRDIARKAIKDFSRRQPDDTVLDGLLSNARAASSHSHERTTEPCIHRCAIFALSSSNSQASNSAKPSAYACIIPYSTPL